MLLPSVGLDSVMSHVDATPVLGGQLVTVTALFPGRTCHLQIVSQISFLDCSQARRKRWLVHAGFFDSVGGG